ncbi:MAG: SUMF1/EgtB/PvdO family nonheme iron enzyme [Candidatus Bipolaricaulota bacterium]
MRSAVRRFSHSRTSFSLALACFILAVGGGTVGSDVAAPLGMVLIPGGSFQMGDAFAEGCYDELPVHTVTLSAFYMGACEVTNDEMLSALQWAQANGRVEVTDAGVYSVGAGRKKLLHLDLEECRIDWDGRRFSLKEGKASGYPCVEVTWHGAVAYCNFRSEMEGRVPCYDLETWTCDWADDGYRLPTDAEWERAARGGAEGHRFTWSDTETIDHTRANYESTGAQSYDVSLTRGLHPDYDDGQAPYTSPVGSFPANAYGLYDMEGNVWEWIWDYWDPNYYLSSPLRDPRGPDSGEYRVVRSGRWGYDASACRVSARRHGWPAGRRQMGFRLAMNAEI